MENGFSGFFITENRKKLVNETKKVRRIFSLCLKTTQKKNTWKTSYYDVFLHYGKSWHKKKIHGKKKKQVIMMCSFITENHGNYSMTEKGKGTLFTVPLERMGTTGTEPQQYI